MNDYTHRAKKQNKSDIVASICLYVSAAVLYLPSVLVHGIKFVPMLQFLALVLLVFGVFVNQRYTWQVYSYGVVPRENLHDPDAPPSGEYFVVYRTVGKRRTCLAKIDMSGILAFVKCTHKNDMASAFADLGPVDRYDFRTTMMPAVYYKAAFRADGENVVISFEPDETLVGILREAMDSKGGGDGGAELPNK